MTVIVGVEDETGVTIGADSLASRNGFGHKRADDKLFTIDNGDMIVGASGSPRLRQIIRYSFTRPSHDEQSDMEYLVSEFIPQLKDEIDNQGNLAEFDKVKHLDGKLIIGYGGKLFEVHGDMQVCRLQDGHTAIGSGFKVAHGNLYETEGEYSRRERVERALESSAYYTNSVSEPFKILSMDK